MRIFHSTEKKNSALAMLGGLGVGALLMYVLDPQRGARRRALARDKATKLRHRAGETLAARSRDLRNRSRGVAAKTRSLVHSHKDEEVSDDVLAERVRSRIGRAVRHPGSIEVEAENGVVRLSGPVLEDEVDDLVSAVRGTPGVEDVVDLLEAHAEPDDVPGLQGDPRPERETF